MVALFETIEMAGEKLLMMGVAVAADIPLAEEEVQTG